MRSTEWGAVARAACSPTCARFAIVAALSVSSSDRVLFGPFEGEVITALVSSSNPARCVPSKDATSDPAATRTGPVPTRVGWESCLFRAWTSGGPKLVALEPWPLVEPEPQQVPAHEMPEALPVRGLVDLRPARTELEPEPDAWDAHENQVTGALVLGAFAALGSFLAIGTW